MLVDDRTLAAEVGLTRWTLQRWRCTGDGPPFHRVGPRSVRYDPDEVKSWLASRKRTSTADAGDREAA